MAQRHVQSIRGGAGSVRPACASGLSNHGSAATSCGQADVPPLGREADLAKLARWVEVVRKVQARRLDDESWPHYIRLSAAVPPGRRATKATATDSPLRRLLPGPRRGRRGPLAELAAADPRASAEFAIRGYRLVRRRAEDSAVECSYSTSSIGLAWLWLVNSSPRWTSDCRLRQHGGG